MIWKRKKTDTENVAYLGVGSYEQKFITQNKIDSLRRYLATHSIVKFRNFLIDTERLVGERWECHHRKCVKLRGRNCCDGPTHALPEWQVKRIDRDLEGIIRYLPENRRMEIHKRGAWHRTGATRTLDERCLFWYRTPGREERCALQTFAHQQGVDLFSLKPFSCSLYPMEAISIDGKIFLTSYLPPAQPFRFGRWQHRDQWENTCFSESFRKSTPPLYRSLEAFICYSFGEELFEKLTELEGLHKTYIQNKKR